MSDNEDLTLSSPTQSSTRLMNPGHAQNSSDKPLVFSIKPQIPSVSFIIATRHKFDHFFKIKPNKGRSNSTSRCVALFVKQSIVQSALSTTNDCHKQQQQLSDSATKRNSFFKVREQQKQKKTK